MDAKVHVPANIVYDSRTPYNGVFSYFQAQTKTTKIVSRGYISATGSISQDNNPEFPLITKDEYDTYYRSYSGVELWFLVDFKDYIFTMTSYTYRTFFIDFFREWYMKGSIDGVTYEDIHHQENYKLPSNTYHTENFKATNIKPYRYFKIIPIGSTLGGSTFLAIHRLEFYGILNSKDALFRKRISCIIHAFRAKIIPLFIHVATTE